MDRGKTKGVTWIRQLDPGGVGQGSGVDVGSGPVARDGRIGGKHVRDGQHVAN